MHSVRIRQFTRICIMATFFVPLVVISSRFIFPFIVPKILLFRTLVLLMAAGYVLLIFADRERYRLRLTPITGMVTLFFVSFAVSTFTGADWYRSFWDNHERMLGLFTVAHYFIYYFVVASVVREEREWQSLARVFAVAAALVMLIALVQTFRPEFMLNRGAERVSATLGNPIYLGGYGLFLFFFAALFARRERQTAWRYIMLAAGALGFFGIFMSGTRGSLLGLLAGLFIGGIFYLIRNWRDLKVRRVGLGLFGSVMIFAGILFAARDVPLVRGLPAVGPLLHMSISGDSAGTRLLAWQIAVDSWKDKPVFGWGPNNFYYAFNQHYRPEFLRYGWAETWFDNAHNIILNTLAVQGIVGLVTYLALFLVTIWMIVRAEKRDRMDSAFAALAIGFLVAHLTQNIFVFENPTSYLYFFFFLAMINGQVRASEAKDSAPKSSLRASYGSAALIFAVALLFIYSTNVNAARANSAALSMIKLANQGVSPVASYRAIEAIPTPHIDDIRIDIGRAALDMVPKLLQTKREADARALFDLAYGEVSKNRALHPLDVRVHILQAELTQSGFEMTKNAAWILSAEEILSDALVKSPRRQQIEYFLAGIKASLGKSDEAVALLRASIANDPKVKDGWIKLVELYRNLGRPDDALAAFEDAKKAGIAFSSFERNLLVPVMTASSAQK